jgi:TolB-like protein
VNRPPAPPRASTETTPNAATVTAELERIAASPGFRKAQRCTGLLRFLVGHVLARREAELKEYTIAVGALDRSEAFDSRTDPVVRLEARRLRLKLAEYYQQDGLNDLVVIELPKGAYVPLFRFRQAPMAAETQIELPRQRHGQHRIAMAAAAFLLTLVSVAVYAVRLPRAATRVSVAVLSFRDNSPRQDLGYFADGVRDGLISDLVSSRGLDVTARASSGQRVAGQDDPVEFAHRLQADAVVSGSVSPTGDRVEVVVTLIGAKTGKFLWSKTYQASASDLSTIQRSAASGIAQALGGSADITVPTLPTNPAAADLYLRAYSLYRTRQGPQMREAAPMFARVIALEPRFAPAYAAAASNYLVAANNGVMPWREAAPKGEELSRQSVDLDPELADAHAARALSWQVQWRWRESDEELERAIELDPRSPVPHFRRAYNLAIMRRFDEAHREVETARLLDSEWSAPHGLLGELYFYERRYGEAFDLIRQFRSSQPEFFDNLTAEIYLAQGKRELAKPILLQLPSPFEQALGRAIGGDAQAQYRELVRKRSSSFISAYEIASFTALLLQDPKLTFQWLEQSLEDRDPNLVSLGLDPMWDQIRGDPRGAAILRQLNLPAIGPGAGPRSH